MHVRFNFHLPDTSLKIKIQDETQISFCKILEYK